MHQTSMIIELHYNYSRDNKITFKLLLSYRRWDAKPSSVLHMQEVLKPSSAVVLRTQPYTHTHTKHTGSQLTELHILSTTLLNSPG